LAIAAGAVILATPLAIGAGWLLARRNFPGKTLLHLLMLSPLVLPPVVTGYLLLNALGRHSWIGELAQNWFGIELTFSTTAAVIAAMVMGLPLFVSSVRIAIENVPEELEEVAEVSGASTVQIFWRITLPAAWTGILAGALLAFARGMGEFGATVILAGHLQGEDATLALAVYEALDDPSGDTEVWFLTVLSILATFVFLIAYETLTRSHRHRNLP